MKYTSENICKYTLVPRHTVIVEGRVFICHKNKSPSCQQCTVIVTHKFRPLFYQINAEKDLKGTFNLVFCEKLVSRPLCIVNLISPSIVRMASDDITNSEELTNRKQQGRHVTLDETDNMSSPALSKCVEACVQFTLYE